ncbi:MAG: DUF3261 domain-containing protein [Aliivibrio sp.]|uniref:DUF3261 domain-containing protein n=1 Tax=Aliivibrio sp. TaxID=1872443 RepID=UPI001A5840DB|nr:DUF3261 domain-containing protein [Aliivibrio sp.]
MINTPNNRHIKWMAVLSVIVIGGCSSTSDNTDSKRGPVTNFVSPSNKVELQANTFVELPTAAEFGSNLNASQLITVDWNEQQHKLPVQLEVDSEKVVLAGFASWGSTLLSVTYDNHSFETFVMPGLSDTLPEPKQVLFNIMVTLWPIDTWTPRLSKINWTLTQSNKQRLLKDENGDVVIRIDYATKPYLQGDIVITNVKLDYTITIKTYQYRH